jgi:hypothetical protein
VSLLSAQPPPTFIAANRTVAVFATVSDESGRLAPDLTRDQFQLLDKSKPVDLSIFDDHDGASPEELPGRRGTRRIDTGELTARPLS